MMVVAKNKGRTGRFPVLCMFSNQSVIMGRSGARLLPMIRRPSFSTAQRSFFRPSPILFAPNPCPRRNCECGRIPHRTCTPQVLADGAKNALRVDDEAVCARDGGPFVALIARSARVGGCRRETRERQRRKEEAGTIRRGGRLYRQIESWPSAFEL